MIIDQNYDIETADRRWWFSYNF